MSGVTLQDLVYFGTAWQIVQKTADLPAIELGGGFQDSQVIRSADGIFFAGVVEKTNAQGAVTDVVLAFSGAVTADDFVAGESILANVPTDQGDQAVAIYSQLLADPRYANAKIHVTGHSLGAGLTQYVLGYALTTQGEAATDARADFTQFGTPGWGASVAAHFGISTSEFAGRITGYAAANDPVLVNGLSYLGVETYLAAYHTPGVGETVATDNVSAHWPTTYMTALGLPDWLSTADQASVLAYVASQSNTPVNLDYGPPGTVAVTVQGDAAANLLTGSSANDVLIGAGGADTLFGGAGADLFVFSAAGDSGPDAAHADTILDFSSAEGDRLDLRGLASTLPLVWREHVSFIGQAAFTHPGQVRSWSDGHDTWVAGDFGTTTTVTFLVKLAGVHAISAADILVNDALGDPVVHTGYQPY